MTQVKLHKIWILVWIVCLLWGCDGAEMPTETFTLSHLGSVNPTFNHDATKAPISTVDQGVQHCHLKQNQLLYPLQMRLHRDAGSSVKGIFKLPHQESQTPEVNSLSLAQKNPFGTTVDIFSLVIWDFTQGQSLRHWALAIPLDIALPSIRICKINSDKFLKKFDFPTRSIFRLSVSISLAASLFKDNQSIVCESTNRQGYRFA